MGGVTAHPGPDPGPEPDPAPPRRHPWRKGQCPPVPAADVTVRWLRIWGARITWTCPRDGAVHGGVVSRSDARWVIDHGASVRER